MFSNTPVFTKCFLQIIEIIRHMASPEGTTIKELICNLSLTRRSVFRVISIMENDFNIPIIVKRDTFGGLARYFLPKPFVDSFSQITLPKINLSFGEAVTLYLISALPSFSKRDDIIGFNNVRDIFRSFPDTLK
jgi:hypothetical protein